MSTVTDISDSTMHSLMNWAYPDEWKGWLLSAAGGLVSSAFGSLIQSTWISEYKSQFSNAFGGASAISNEVYHATNTLVKVIIDPNIAGIPIKSMSEEISRSVDVSEQATVVEDEGKGRQYVTDSAAPRPREFHVTGYLSSLSLGTDVGWLIKPTLKFQMAWLDSLSKIRIPIWYKTYYGDFLRVLISNIKFNQDPKVQNGIAVDITLKEYVEMSVTMDTFGSAASTEVDTNTCADACNEVWTNTDEKTSSLINASKQETSSAYTSAKNVIQSNGISKGEYNELTTSLMVNEQMYNASTSTPLAFSSGVLPLGLDVTSLSGLDVSNFYSLIQQMSFAGGI